ncbi:MAG: CDP-alcohol phosphatidyltransferase family protein [Ignavibacteriaceae bacterium]
MYKKNEIYTISNLLSFLRLLMAIPFWILIGNINEPGTRNVIAALAIIAALTDWLDGFVARKRNEVTELGKIIDPLADKIAIGAIIIRLYMVGEIPEYYFYLIIGRDLLIFIGGVIVSKVIGKVLPSNILGKITVSMIGMVILLIVLEMSRSSYLFQFFYYGSIILIIVSFFAYVYRAVEYIKKENN